MEGRYGDTSLTEQEAKLEKGAPCYFCLFQLLIKWVKLQHCAECLEP